MGRFSAGVRDWTKKTKARQVAIFRIAVQKVVDDMLLTIPKSGNMPIDTGNLRRSLKSSTSSMPEVIGDSDFQFGNDLGGIELTIANASAGDTLYLGFQAAYARRMEHGFQGIDSLGRTYNQAGFAFVGQAALNWKRYVGEAVRETG